MIGSGLQALTTLGKFKPMVLGEIQAAGDIVANSPWSDEKMLAKVREQVVSSMTQRGPIALY